MNYILDIVTSGLNPDFDKILTIQYQKIDNSGNPIGDFIILKEWEEGEEQIVKKFHSVFVSFDMFIFIPLMQNHLFVLMFLFRKFKKYGLSLRMSEIDYLYNGRNTGPGYDASSKLFGSERFTPGGSELSWIAIAW